MIKGVFSRMKTHRTVARPQGYIEWDFHTISNFSPTADADYFMENGSGVGVRASIHWTGNGFSKVSVNGESFLRIYIDPRNPDLTSESKVQYRREFSRSWTTGSPVGTREILGFGYYLPSALKTRQQGIDIFQWHTGSALGGPYPNNYPVLYGGIYPAGTADKYGDVCQQDELVIINKAQAHLDGNSGRVNTGIIFTPNVKRYFMIDYLSGIAGQGRVIIKCKEGSGEWTTIYDKTELTVWLNNSDGGSRSMVHPDWKLGVYAHGISSVSELNTEELTHGVGGYNIDMYMTRKVKNAKLLAADPQYTANVLGTINPSI
jgi:hypothetical protein